MKSTLTIKDLALDKELDGKSMSSVRGGAGDQANATMQSNAMALFAPVSVGNGSLIGGGPVNFQVTSDPTQTATNSSTSTNFKSLDLFGALPIFAD
jgi:hypothetical protein